MGLGICFFQSFSGIYLSTRLPHAIYFSSLSKNVNLPTVVPLRTVVYELTECRALKHGILSLLESPWASPSLLNAHWICEDSNSNCLPE